MADVMLSIRPKWCELIALGKKTVEVRKTRPRKETPFKCYIYQTLPKSGDWKERDGQVIGEFVCSKISRYAVCGSNKFDKRYCEVDSSLYIHDIDFSKLRLTPNELQEYGNGACLFGWHISELVIYDKPKELISFWTRKDRGAWSDWKQMKRPPQSWCYVEEA